MRRDLEPRQVEGWFRRRSAIMKCKHTRHVSPFVTSAWYSGAKYLLACLFCVFVPWHKQPPNNNNLLKQRQINFMLGCRRRRLRDEAAIGSKPAY